MPDFKVLCAWLSFFLIWSGGAINLVGLIVLSGSGFSCAFKTYRASSGVWTSYLASHEFLSQPLSAILLTCEAQLHYLDG